MAKNILAVICVVILNIYHAKAQDVEYQQIARRVFSKCIKRSKIYPKEKYGKSFFDNVSLHPIPLCEINGDSLTVIHDKCPYLIIITKDDQYVGVVSSDDVGNSYIDIDFVYGYNGTIKTIWNLMQRLSKECITLYNMLGVNDQIVFTSQQGQNLYLDLIFTDVDDNSPLGIDNFRTYSVDSIPNYGLLPRDAKKNSKRNLSYYTIDYD